MFLTPEIWDDPVQSLPSNNGRQGLLQPLGRNAHSAESTVVWFMPLLFVARLCLERCLCVERHAVKRFQKCGLIVEGRKEAANVLKVLRESGGDTGDYHSHVGKAD